MSDRTASFRAESLVRLKEVLNLSQSDTKDQPRLVRNDCAHPRSATSLSTEKRMNAQITTLTRASSASTASQLSLSDAGARKQSLRARRRSRSQICSRWHPTLGPGEEGSRARRACESVSWVLEGG